MQPAGQGNVILVLSFTRICSEGKKTDDAFCGRDLNISRAVQNILKGQLIKDVSMSEAPLLEGLK